MRPVRSAIWSDPRVKPPYGVAELDPQHPLARGLQFAYLFNEHGSRTFDAAKPAHVGTFSGSPLWSPRGGLDIAGSDFVDIVEPVDTPFLGAITILWAGVIDTGAAFRHFAGKHAGNGGTATPFDYRTTDAATPLMVLGRANAGGFKLFNGPAVSLLRSRAYGVTTETPIETVPTFYIDGQPTAGVDAGGAGAGAPTGSGANLRIGRRADGGVQMDGVVEYFYLWSRVLSAGELAWLHAEPYAMFRPAGVRRIGPLTLTAEEELPIEAGGMLTIATEPALPVEASGWATAEPALPVEAGATLVAEEPLPLEAEGLNPWQLGISFQIRKKLNVPLSVAFNIARVPLLGGKLAITFSVRKALIPLHVAYDVTPAQVLDLFNAGVGSAGPSTGYVPGTGAAGLAKNTQRPTGKVTKT